MCVYVYVRKRIGRYICLLDAAQLPLIPSYIDFQHAQANSNLCVGRLDEINPGRYQLFLRNGKVT